MDLNDPHLVPPTTEQIAHALVDVDRQADWFSAGADATATEGSFAAYDNLCRALLGAMYEGGFPLPLFVQMVQTKLNELDDDARDSGCQREPRDVSVQPPLRGKIGEPREIGMQGRWSNDA